MNNKFSEGMEEFTRETGQVPTANGVYPPQSLPSNRSGLMRVLDNQDIQGSGFHLSVLGLELDRQVSEKEWLSFGAMLFRFQGYMQLFIGDWLLVGERQWGKTYKDIAVLFKRKPKTLRNFRWVCGSVEMSLRRDNLTYSHYKEVASLTRPEQERLLSLASENGWSVARLHKAIPGNSTPSSTKPIDRAQKQLEDYTRFVIEQKDEVPYMEVEQRQQFIEQSRFLGEYYTRLANWAEGREE